MGKIKKETRLEISNAKDLISGMAEAIIKGCEKLDVPPLVIMAEINAIFASLLAGMPPFDEKKDTFRETVMTILDEVGTKTNKEAKGLLDAKGELLEVAWQVMKKRNAEKNHSQ